MTPEKFKEVKSLIKHESDIALDVFLSKEIERQPEIENFLLSLKNSNFYRGFFMRGFIEGMDYSKRLINEREK